MTKEEKKKLRKVARQKARDMVDLEISRQRAELEGKEVKKDEEK